MPTEKRNEFVLVRLAESEKARLSRNAETARCSVSEYVRRCAVYIDEQPPNDREAEELAAMNYELRKQGNNLNQLMHYLNTYKAGAFDPARVEKVLDAIAACSDEARRRIISMRKGARR